MQRGLRRAGAAKGGKAAAESLGAKRPVEIARKAVQARWAKARDKPLQGELIVQVDAIPVAQYRGFLNLVELDVPCYVLENGVRS